MYVYISMAKCVVCNMVVSENTLHKTVYNGKTYYFCSKECLDEFKSNPNEYV